METPGQPLTYEDARAVALQLGYTHAETMAGPLPLDSWDGPYGQYRSKSYRCNIINGRIVDVDTGKDYPGRLVVLGSFPLSKG